MFFNKRITAERITISWSRSIGNKIGISGIGMSLQGAEQESKDEFTRTRTGEQGRVYKDQNKRTRKSLQEAEQENKDEFTRSRTREQG